MSATVWKRRGRRVLQWGYDKSADRPSPERVSGRQPPHVEQGSEPARSKACRGAHLKHFTGPRCRRRFGNGDVGAFYNGDRQVGRIGRLRTRLGRQPPHVEQGSWKPARSQTCRGAHLKHFTGPRCRRRFETAGVGAFYNGDTTSRPNRPSPERVSGRQPPHVEQGSWKPARSEKPAGVLT